MSLRATIDGGVVLSELLLYTYSKFRIFCELVDETHWGSVERAHAIAEVYAARTHVRVALQARACRLQSTAARQPIQRARIKHV